MDETTTATGPNLASLPYHTRLSIAVAECRGEPKWHLHTGVPFWTGGDWRYGGAWVLWVGDQRVVDVSLEPPTGRFGALRLRDGYRDVVRDPAAWGAVMVAERISLQPVHTPVGEPPLWLARPWPLSEDPERGEVYGAEPGVLVALAVLAKYGRTVEP